MKIAGATWLLTFFCEGKLYGNIASRMIIFKTINCTKTSNHCYMGDT